MHAKKVAVRLQEYVDNGVIATTDDAHASSGLSFIYWRNRITGRDSPSGYCVIE